MIIKTKKAILLNEYVSNIIIAALCILVLLGFGVAIYNTFMGNSKELKQADASLEIIVNAISDLKTGESKEVLIESPAEWRIVFFPQEHWFNEKFYPATCNNGACICICKSDDSFSCSNVKEGICKPMNVEQFKLSKKLFEEFDILEIIGHVGQAEPEIYKSVSIQIESPTLLKITLNNEKELQFKKL